MEPCERGGVNGIQLWGPWTMAMTKESMQRGWKRQWVSWLTVSKVCLSHTQKRLIPLVLQGGLWTQWMQGFECDEWSMQWNQPIADIEHFIAQCQSVKEHGNVGAQEECTNKASAHLWEIFVTVKDVVSRCELGKGRMYAKHKWKGYDTRACN